MKKKFLSILLALTMCLSLLPTAALAEEITKPDIIIDTVEKLKDFRDEVNNGKLAAGTRIRLDADLDLSGIANWVPIGTTASPFRGTFNGNGHTISGLKIKVSNGASTSDTRYGLFGEINEGTVKDLTVCGEIDVSWAGDQDIYIGGIVGELYNAILQNCHFSGQVSGSMAGTARYCNIGGAAGTVEGINGTAEVINCSNAGTVTAQNEASTTIHIGGVMGNVYVFSSSSSSTASIESCYNTGVVTGNGKNCTVGGLMGLAYSLSDNSNQSSQATSTVGIKSCYNTGAVTGSIQSGEENGLPTVGGLIGKLAVNGNNPSTIKNCYNVGAVTGSDLQETGSVAGVVASGAAVQSCVYHLPLGGTAIKGIGKGTDTTMKAETVTALANPSTFSGWDLTSPGTAWVMSPFRPLLKENLEVKAVGAGTAEDPYQIATVYDLNAFRDLVNANADLNGDAEKGKYSTKCYQLTADLNLDSTRRWTAIGTDTAPFQGTFDGNGHTISGVWIDATSENNEGFFGTIKNPADSTSCVKNLAVSGNLQRTITLQSGTLYMGGIVGYCEGTIENCRFSGTVCGDVYDGSTIVGGVAGYANEIRNCCNTGTVKGSSDSSTIGGVAGIANEISNCCNTGKVNTSTSTSGTVGGVAGNANKISNCYNTGSVSYNNFGGKIGGVVGALKTSISNCFYQTDTDETENKLQGISGQADVVGKVEAATAQQFASGEIAWKLQAGQSTPSSQVWGQALTGDAKDISPVLTTSATKAVYQVAFQENSAEETTYVPYATRCANPGGTVTLPATTSLTKEGYTFAEWSTAKTNGSSFNEKSIVNADTLVYSQWTLNQYTVTFDADGGSAVDPQKPYHGDTITKPTDPTKIGYTFDNWYNGANQWNFDQDTVTGDLTLTAKWTLHTNHNYVDGVCDVCGAAQSSGGGGGSSKPSSPSTPTVTVPVTSDKGSVDVKAEVSGSTASVEIGDKEINQVVNEGVSNVTVDLSGLNNVENAQFPAHVLENTNHGDNASVTVSLPTGTISLDNTALNSVTVGKDVTFSVQCVPATDLNEAQQAAVGDMANIGIVVDVDISVGGTKQSHFNGGTLTISVPYTPKKNEDVSKLTVWYLKDDGTIQPMGGYYDEENKCFVFETTHLSRYVIVSVENMPSFTDVPDDAYYADAVTWAVLNGITTGMTETTFGPDLSCTRAQIVTFLWRAAGQPEVKDVENPFSDVRESDYFYQAVLWAVEQKITTGTTETTFSPEDTCTRAQAAAFLYRNEQANGNGFTDNWAFQLPFTDVPDWCYEAVAWCYMNGVTQGTSENTFSPDLDCTRAQIVTMLYRVSAQ